MADNAGKIQRLADVADVFTPGAPIDSSALFAGRLPLVMDVLNALAQRGQHVVLYGERGVGKTSLANVLSEFIAERDNRNLNSIRTNCGTNDDFTTLWDRVFRRLGLAEDEPAQTSFGRSLGPEDVREALEKLEARTLVVIDELDRLEDNEALSLLADTVKALSDYSVPATLMLVGVADSVDELVGDHRSIQRALIQVQMPRMVREELGQIIDNGIQRLNMKIDSDARERIARLSEGLPHYTHLLSLFAAQRAVADDRMDVDNSDVEAAIHMAVEKAQQTIRSAYHLATHSARKDNLFADVLLACALAPKNDMGYFTAGGVREPMSRIMNRRFEIPAFARHLTEFSEDVRGSVLQKRGSARRHFYRFEDPLLQPFVILNGLAQGRITEDRLRDLQDADGFANAPPNELPQLS